MQTNDVYKKSRLLYVIEAAIGFIFNVFFGKTFFILYYVCYAVSQAGINSGTVNLLYDYVPTEKRTGCSCY